MQTKISYQDVSAFEGWGTSTEQYIVDGILRGRRGLSVLEIGAGRSPTLALETTRELELDYTLLDVASTELARADAKYHRIIDDISSPHFAGAAPSYDLVFSRMTCEHVRRAETFHRNILAILNPGGLALHFFPTLYAFPFLANRFLPQRAAKAITTRFMGRGPATETFKAYYRACRGPTRRQLRSLEKWGYEIEEYVGYFGHGYYKAWPPLAALGERLTHRLLRRPRAEWTSYARVLLKKPDAS